MSQVRVAIACQGGGNFTAYTAGVLSGILREIERRNKSGSYTVDRFEVVGLSGTAGGAVCALLAWYGLINDEGKHPVKLLRDFWFDNEESLKVINSVYFPQLEPLFQSPWSFFHQEWLHLMDSWLNWQVALKLLLERVVNFDRLKEMPDRAKIMLQVGAVNAGTGDFQIFSNWATERPDSIPALPGWGGEDFITGNILRDRPVYLPGIYNPSQETGITPQTLLTSSSLPFIFPASQIGQNYFYDGLFSQNPPLKDLPDCTPDEIWLIRTHAEPQQSGPVFSNEVLARHNKLACNLTLAQEIRFMVKIQELLAQNALHGKYQPVNLLEIPTLVPLNDSSRTGTYRYSQPFIDRLLVKGEEAALYFFDQTRPLQMAGWEKKRRDWAESASPS